jgi:hypothetical protein
MRPSGYELACRAVQRFVRINVWVTRRCRFAGHEDERAIPCFLSPARPVNCQRRLYHSPPLTLEHRSGVLARVAVRLCYPRRPLEL